MTWPEAEEASCISAKSGERYSISGRWEEAQYEGIRLLLLHWVLLAPEVQDAKDARWLWSSCFLRAAYNGIVIMYQRMSTESEPCVHVASVNGNPWTRRRLS